MNKRMTIGPNMYVSASVHWNLLKTEPAYFPVTVLNNSGTKHTLLDFVLNNTEIRPKKHIIYLFQKYLLLKNRLCSRLTVSMLALRPFTNDIPIKSFYRSPSTYSAVTSQ